MIQVRLQIKDAFPAILQFDKNPVVVQWAYRLYIPIHSNLTGVRFCTASHRQGLMPNLQRAHPCAAQSMPVPDVTAYAAILRLTPHHRLSELMLRNPHTAHVCAAHYGVDCPENTSG